MAQLCDMIQCAHSTFMPLFGGCAMGRSLYRSAFILIGVAARSQRDMHMRLLLTTLVVSLTANVAFAQEHSAHWYNKDAATGKFSVILNVPDGTEAIVAVAREKGIDVLVMDIDELTYQRKILNCAPAACYPPLILLGVDKDMNGKYEADDYRWQWSLASGSPDPRLLHGDTFIQCEAQAPAAPDLTFVHQDVYNTYRCYSPDHTGTAYSPVYELLPFYQAGLAAVFTGITPAHHILAIKAHAGGNVVWMDFNALVDRVTLSGFTRIDEPNNSRSHFEVVTSH
jgi:hypothetical protein